MLVLPVLALISRRDLAARSGFNGRSIERYLYKGVRPHSQHQDRLVAVAIDHARSALRAGRRPEPRDHQALIHAYLAMDETDRKNLWHESAGEYANDRAARDAYRQ